MIGPTLLVFAALALHPEATISVEGQVRDRAGAPLPGVSVRVERLALALETDAEGRFRLLLPAGAWTLRLRRDGFLPAALPLVVEGRPLALQCVLQQQPRLIDEVVVRAIRADEEMPVTKTGLDRDAVARLHHGQETPFLLGHTPAVTFQSDSGAPSGYSYFSLRGIAQTRVNLTLDGVPLNDPEDAGVYFSNFGDFAGAVESIQIVRGVSTSTVGAAAYGGAVSFTSLAPAPRPRLEGDAGAGSFGGGRLSLAGHSGRWRQGPALWARGSLLTSDGYRRHSGVKQRSAFFGGNWQWPRGVVAFSGLSGRERTRLAFLATDAATLEADPRFNPLAPEEIDRFGQDLLQLQAARQVGAGGTLALQAYYNGARGWYQLWDAPAEPRALLRYGIDGRMLGARLSAALTRGRLAATWGLHAADFERDHDLRTAGPPAYANTGHKDEGNTFVKLAYGPPGWRFDLEAQLRLARFRYRGDRALAPVDWAFLNARLGARRQISPALHLYATAGRVAREPTRNDLFEGEDNPSLPYDLRAVRPERVRGLELGTGWRGKRLEAQANVYAMAFRDEIALTGELSPIGLPLRRNVARSWRRGLELEAAWRLRPDLRLRLAGHLGRGRLHEWRQFYDVFDAEGTRLGQAARVHRAVEPLASPRLTADGEVEWQPRQPLAVALSARGVSRSYLDNTADPRFATPSLLDLGASLRVELSRRPRLGRPQLKLVAGNLLDRRLRPAGYSYLYLTRRADGQESVDGTAYYFPLASRSVTAVLSLRFGE